jgi:hypothetical protein
MSYTLSSTLTSRWFLSFRDKVIDVHTETTTIAASENIASISPKRMSGMSGTSSGHASRRTSQASSSERRTSRANSPRNTVNVDTSTNNTVASRQSQRVKRESMTPSVRFVLDDTERRGSLRIETGGSTGRRSNRNSASTLRSIIKSTHEADHNASNSPSSIDGRDTSSRSKMTNFVDEIIEEKDQL